VSQLKKHAAEVKVKCVWDHDLARAEKRAHELGVPVEADLAKIWADPQIIAVVIASETDRHVELVTAAAKAKKHVYAEKPLGMGAQDAYAMAQAVQDAGVTFQTGYFMRGDPKLLFLKEQMAAGSFGKVTRIRGSNCHNGALGGWFDKEWRWMADPKVAGVGAYGDLGTHALDVMLWLMNEPISRGTATTSMGTGRYAGCEELGEGIVVFEGGAIGTLAAGWDDVANPVSLEICGTEGHATIVNDQLFFQSKHASGADGKRAWTKLPEGLPRPLELFIAALNGKANVPLVTVREAAYRCAVMDALYQGAREQKWVAPPAMSPHKQ
jgi:predicted dehydrogenase